MDTTTQMRWRITATFSDGTVHYQDYHYQTDTAAYRVDCRQWARETHRTVTFVVERIGT